MSLNIPTWNLSFLKSSNLHFNLCFLSLIRDSLINWCEIVKLLRNRGSTNIRSSNLGLPFKLKLDEKGSNDKWVALRLSYDQTRLRQYTASQTEIWGGQYIAIQTEMWSRAVHSHPNSWDMRRDQYTTSQALCYEKQWSFNRTVDLYPRLRQGRTRLSYIYHSRN